MAQLNNTVSIGFLARLTSVRQCLNRFLSSCPGEMTANATITDPPDFDEETFKTFAPLLRQSLDYARLSGFRFIAETFKHSDSPQDDSSSSSCSFHGNKAELVAALRKAAPVVDAFRKRLLARDDSRLNDELDRAFRVVMLEGVRNAMISTCRSLEIFPPTPPPYGVDTVDCAYEDTTAPLPVIAQRLHNDHLRRHATAASAMGLRLKRRALTASFLVDFASEAGVTLPDTPEAFQTMLEEFVVRTSEWAALQGPSAQLRAADAVGKATTSLRSAEGRHQLWVECQKHGQMAMWSTVQAAGVTAGACVTPVLIPIAICAGRLIAQHLWPSVSLAVQDVSSSSRRTVDRRMAIRAIRP